MMGECSLSYDIVMLLYLTMGEFPLMMTDCIGEMFLDLLMAKCFNNICWSSVTISYD